MRTYKCVGLVFNKDLKVGYALVNLNTLQVTCLLSKNVIALAEKDEIVNMQFAGGRLDLFECSAKRLPYYDINGACIGNADMSVLLKSSGDIFIVMTSNLVMHKLSRAAIADALKAGRLKLANGTLTSKGTLRIFNAEAIPTSLSISGPSSGAFVLLNSRSDFASNFFKMSKQQFLATYSKSVTEMQYRAIYAFVIKSLDAETVFSMLADSIAKALLTQTMTKERPLVVEFGFMRFEVFRDADGSLTSLTMIGAPDQSFCYGNLRFNVMNNSIIYTANIALFNACYPNWKKYHDEFAAEYAAAARAKVLQPV